MIQKQKEINGKVISLETGRMAKQADGSVIARVGDTVVMATVVADNSMRVGADFVPLSVDYREKFYSSGRIPGGFIKREGRPSEREVLSARLIDRQIRPLLPKNWYYETQVMVSVLSYDGENQPDILGAVAATSALSISNIPFDGPVSTVRVGRKNGKLIVNPLLEEIEEGDVEMIIAGSKDSINMVEGEANEISEKDFIEVMKLAHKSIIETIELQEEFVAEINPEKREKPEFVENDELEKEILELAESKIDNIIQNDNKTERVELTGQIFVELEEKYGEDYEEISSEVKDIVHDIIKDKVRSRILKDKIRIDGRKPDEIRKITTEVSVLPRTHGSALFTRGETQALVVTTLGTIKDSQLLDNIDGSTDKHYMLQYNFPPFATGETKMRFSVSRREIGHGNLAERSLKYMVPTKEDFPYTIRVVSDVLESNGSSSMASVCGGCLSLMDAGVKMKKMVSGIAMGMVTDGDNFVVLSDILGEEDHYGDMDFKVTGTKDGITAIQMDLKIRGLSFDRMEDALSQARDGRMHILNKMEESLTASREELNEYAPRITSITVPVDKIGDIIGPSGKMIKEIVAKTGVEIDIDQDENAGRVNIFSNDSKAAKEAEDIILSIIEEPEVGKTYEGVVKNILDFGAFVEILPGTDGLVHISELKWERVEKVTDVLKTGDKVKVKLIGMDRGKLKLSIKALLEKPEGFQDRSRDNDRNRDRGNRDRRNR
ncbi:MAG: polyribonucleotide nucleotidyltransferase [Candidatus Marinimicrobia bacterium]|nr:polyribonucleotide nucleotidyltransferase [Candidatus Neomarinimicrobiota bacterium]